VKVYLDNVIVSGIARNDPQPPEMAAPVIAVARWGAACRVRKERDRGDV